MLTMNCEGVTSSHQATRRYRGSSPPDTCGSWIDDAGDPQLKTTKKCEGFVNLWGLLLLSREVWCSTWGPGNMHSSPTVV